MIDTIFGIEPNEIALMIKYFKNKGIDVNNKKELRRYIEDDLQ